jgi:hypothetical protein
MPPKLTRRKPRAQHLVQGQRTRQRVPEVDYANILSADLPVCSWTRRTGSQLCGNYLCPACFGRKVQKVARDVHAFLMLADHRGLLGRWITFTQPPGRDGSGVLHLSTFNAAFRRIRRTLDRDGFFFGHYYSVLGISNFSTGRMDRHVVALDGTDMPAGQFEALLREHARPIAGLGPIVHVRPIGSTPQDRLSIANYAGRNAADFIAFHARPGQRSPRPDSRSK